MSGLALDYFNNYKMVRDANSSSAFYSCLSEENKQDATSTHDCMINIYQNLIDEQTIK